MNRNLAKFLRKILSKLYRSRLNAKVSIFFLDVTSCQDS